MDKVLCIGAAHVDRKAKAQSDVLLGTSIPVSVSTSLGGVARNVAENLARLQCPVALLSRVGDDPEGTGVRFGCQSLGIDISMLSRSLTCPTASYTALIDPKGDMVVALANMDIYEELTSSVLEPFMPEMQKYSSWFLDTNFPVKTLGFLLGSSSYTGTVFVDPVSVAKAKKLQGLLQHVDYIFPSRDEAEMLSGVTISTSADAEKAGKKLCQLGVKHAVITLGAVGVCVVDSTSCRHLPALTADSVCDVTGAGDALIAGVIFGISTSLSLGNSIRYGIAAAALTIETCHTVSPFLSRQLISKKLKESESCA
jgi:pseudouridine kinase